MSKIRTPLDQRLWAKVDKSGSCWVWTGPLTNGYGVISSGGRGGSILRTHRVAYELLIGPIPDGLHVDHLCRNRACCNPSHLEPVSQQENNRRARADINHCPHGHLLPPRRESESRRRQCKTCRSEYDRARYQQRNAA